MKRILVTGGREWTDRATILKALVQHGPGVVVHGACGMDEQVDGRIDLRGADIIADDSVTFLRQHNPVWSVEPHPAHWDRFPPKMRKQAGPMRNQFMVDLGADVCLAFPDPDSKGTWDCVRRARKAGIPVHVFEPEEK